MAGPHWIIDLDLSRVFAQAEVGRFAAITGKCFKGDDVVGGDIVAVRFPAHRSLNIPPRLNQQPTIRIVLTVADGFMIEGGIPTYRHYIDNTKFRPRLIFVDVIEYLWKTHRR